MKKAKILIIILSILFLSGCAAFGSKTIYKSESLKSEYNKIGYSQIASEEILDQIRPNTSSIFQLAFNDFFKNNSIQIEKYNLTKFESIDDINTLEINRICNENNLDGYICTQIKYKFVTSYYMFIPLDKSEDAYVEMKLYDENGILVLHTKHNTSAGNSYLMAPTAELTIRDGTIGALKQMAKEIEKVKRF